MGIVEQTPSQSIPNTTRCPMLDNPPKYIPFLVSLHDQEVTLIPAESLDDIPTSFAGNCIQESNVTVPSTFACLRCRRYGGIGQ